MKKTLLSALVFSTFAINLTPAHAIYNLYKKDGLSLDINGEINLYAEQDKVNVTGQFAPLANVYQELTDERLRLMPDMGSSWIDFRTSQTLRNDWRVTGTLGLGYMQGNTGIYLNSANLSLDKLNVGAITIGRQYLHTGHVTRTGTYTPLDTFGEQALRVDYFGIPNLHTSAYYVLPSSTDVREKNDGNSETEAHGVSATYKLPLSNNQSLRFGAGYSSNKANPDRSADSVATNSRNYAVSAEYRIGSFLAAADYGRRDAKMNNSNFISGADSDYLGFKLGYEVTPRFNIMTGYGKVDSKRSYVTGANPLMAVWTETNMAGLPLQLTYPFLFEKVEQEQAYLRGDYYVRENMRVYGQYQKEKTQAKMGNENYAKLDDTSYRVGVSFVF